MSALQGGPDSEGLIFDIDTFAVHDGPGIRMAVYLKGCQLACKWCHSPESRRDAAELVFFRDRCVGCGACVTACPRGLHQVDGRGHVIDREACASCGLCAQHCPHGALAVKGYRIRAGAVVAKAVRLKPFFHHSGGGVTLTGGEVTDQQGFAAAVLAGCRAEGIHTAIETSGACDWERLSSLADHSDLVLYDLKLMDDGAHQRWTGASNRLVLENARRLSGRNVQVRVPLIPGITDTEENLRGIFSFMLETGLKSVALLPYNPSTPAKYEWLGLPCEFRSETQESDELGRFAEMATELGLEATLV